MNLTTDFDKTHWLKEQAAAIGFAACGVSAACFLEEEAPRLEHWLNLNQHGSMHYMANHFDKRLDPRLLVDGAKTVISLLFNYYPATAVAHYTSPIKISTYALGTDYHLVLKEKMKQLVNQMQQQFGEFNYRIFVDSAPVMDKIWAKKSGLGWMGKHTNLINRKMGSYFFIAEVICDLTFQPDEPIKDYCGTCTACLDACPTDALIGPYQIDGSKCISYFTIELKDKIPSEMAGKFESWAFGCDICQDVCPWNRFKQPTTEASFDTPQAWHSWSKEDWLELTEEIFKETFRNSPIKRTKLEGMKRNIQFIAELK